MNDKTDLLGQLRIDRAPEAHREPPSWGWVVGVVLLALVAGLLYLLVSRSADAVPVRLATARALSAVPSGGPSVLDASGYVVARRQATVSSKVTGKVLEVLIEEGQSVQQGQILARIDDSNARAQEDLAEAQLAAARAAVAEIQVGLAEAERQLRRAVELAAGKLVSQAELDSTRARRDQFQAQLDSARRGVSVAERSVDVQQRLLDDTVVRAPFSGVITVKNAQQGEMISPLSAGGAGTRTGIGTLVDMDSLEVEVDVNESFINRVQAGQPVTARLNAYPDWNIDAEVIAVIPTADRSKATVKVRIGLKSRDPRILPDMGVRVAFLGEASKQPGAPRVGVSIPADAVYEGAVFVRHGETVERRAVQTAGGAPGGVLVTAGLREGEEVAIGDFTQLKNGSRVRIER